MARTKSPAAKTGDGSIAAGHPLPRRLLIAGLDGSAAVILSRALARRGIAEIETASTLDEALDVLGIADRPVDLLFLNARAEETWAFELIDILRRHRAPLVAVLSSTLDLKSLLERSAEEPNRLVGIAGFVGLPERLTPIVDRTFSAWHAGATMRRIIDECVVPVCLDIETAIAIYEAMPGADFPRSMITGAG